MLTLYYMSHCPYCIKVLHAAEELGIEITLIEANRNTPERDTVEALGGQSMVPFLVDSNVEPEVRMYESNDIIAYLKEHYGHT